MSDSIPSLRERLIPFLIIGHAVGAIRLALDFYDRELAMWFGQYYVMAIAIAWIGITRRWGIIGWKQMAKTMLVGAPLVFGVWAVIAYSTGQFMEWTDGRFYPGEPITLESGDIEWKDGRAGPPQDSTGGKLLAGLLHGVGTSVASTIWCTFFGTLFVWVYKRPKG